MEKLKNTKKITLATLKSFARRNKDGLFLMQKTAFDGMCDCVMPVSDSEFKKTEITGDTKRYKTGIQGIYTVGSSRDYFQLFENETHIGIEVYNCCGTNILAVKKEIEFIDFEKELLAH